MISIIAAMAENRVIGKRNKLPWHLPADFAWFKRQTLEKPIVMGLNTFKSIGEKPLPRRKSIILHHDPNYQLPEGCLLANSIDQVFELTHKDDEVMVCGGASVYQQFLPLANRLYLTHVHAQVEGDAFFPEFNAAEWQEIFHEYYPADEKNQYAYSFVILDRV